ncbi:MAG: hypothetical protein KA327_05625 [Pseudarcicella sp.]|jgi:hypothetical protein|nr:hypothetical protein [Pseudarcicella sp.]
MELTKKNTATKISKAILSQIGNVSEKSAKKLIKLADEVAEKIAQKIENLKEQEERKADKEAKKVAKKIKENAKKLAEKEAKKARKIAKEEKIAQLTGKPKTFSKESDTDSIVKKATTSPAKPVAKTTSPKPVVAKNEADSNSTTTAE